jgi:hypothetical protein
MKINEIFILETGNETFADNCEQIADDYAIGFGKWILKQCISPSLNDLYVNDKGDLISVKELLEIFKKEKRL